MISDPKVQSSYYIIFDTNDLCKCQKKTFGVRSRKERKESNKRVR